MFRLTPTVKNLLIINFAVYLIHHIFKQYNISVMNVMALRYFAADAFAPYQFFTYMFAHSDSMFRHILFNMLMLFFMGPILESYWGAKRFLSFYLITGIGAGMIYMGIQYFEMRPINNRVETYMNNPTPERFDMFVESNRRSLNPQYYHRMQGFIEDYYKNPTDNRTIQFSKGYMRDISDAVKNSRAMVGASGAIYGLLMAIALLFPNMTFMLIIPPIPVKAKYFALVLGGIALYSELNRQQGDLIAHSAHLGGMIFAFIMIKLWQHKGTSFR